MPAFLRLDRARLHAVERDARVDRLAVDVRCRGGSTYLRTRACETSTSSGTIAPGRAKRARRMAFGRSASRRAHQARDSMVRVSSTTSRSGRMYAFWTAFPARYGIMPPTLRPDRHAEGDRAPGAWRLHGRLGRRRLGRGWVVVGGSVVCAGPVGSRTRFRGEPERGCEAEEGARDEQRVRRTRRTAAFTFPV